MKCDLHVHTNHSFDAASPPEEVVDKAIEMGLECLAITDHNSIAGAKEAAQYAAGKSILIITGNEVKSREGDILALNIKELIPDGLSAKDTIKEIRRQGGFISIAHPFGRICSFKGNLKELLPHIDAIEVFNASISRSANAKAEEFAKKYNLYLTAGSDAHFPNFIGRGYLNVDCEEQSVDAILMAIKEKKVTIGGVAYSPLEYVWDHAQRALVKIKKIVS